MGNEMKDERDAVCDMAQDNDAPVTVDQFLCFALYSTSLAMTRLYQARLKPLGLTYPQYLVMLALWEKDGITVSEVGKRVQLDSGTLSQLLRRLEDSGVICRKRDVGGDERRVLISVTQQGHQLKVRAAGVPADMVSVMDTPYEELAELTARISELREKLIKALP